MDMSRPYDNTALRLFSKIMPIGHINQHDFAKFAKWKSAPAWIPIFQEIGFSMNTDILGKLVPAWIPNPKDKDIGSGEFGSNENADIPGKSASTWIPNPILSERILETLI
ncbi:unnamed protein product [Rhizophagus irregularis]|nr:unnamed protein product [Rhizophagus irregularis]